MGIFPEAENSGASFLICLLLVTLYGHVGSFPCTEPEEQTEVSALTLPGL